MALHVRAHRSETGDPADTAIRTGLMHTARVIQRVRRMKAEGASNSMIGMSIGKTESAVKSLCNKRGIKRGHATGLPFAISPRLTAICTKEAQRRGVGLALTPFAPPTRPG